MAQRARNRPPPSRNGKLPHRALEQTLAARDRRPGDEGAIQPCERRRRDQPARQIIARIADIAVLDGARPASAPARSRRRAAARPLARERRHREFFISQSGVATSSSSRRALPVQGGLQALAARRAAETASASETRAALVSMMHVSAALVAGDRTGSDRAVPARRPPARSRRREISPAPAAATDRVSVRALECDRHIRPFAGRRNLAQPVAQRPSAAGIR